MEYSEEFDIITLIYCDFGVLNPEEREILLKKIYKALKPISIGVLNTFIFLCSKILFKFSMLIYLHLLNDDIFLVYLEE